MPGHTHKHSLIAVKPAEEKPPETGQRQRQRQRHIETRTETERQGDQQTEREEEREKERESMGVCVGGCAQVHVNTHKPFGWWPGHTHRHSRFPSP